MDMLLWLETVVFVLRKQFDFFWKIGIVDGAGLLFKTELNKHRAVGKMPHWRDRLIIVRSSSNTELKMVLKKGVEVGQEHKWRLE